MLRTCTNCHGQFTPKDLAKRESRGMEADRKAAGLQGVLFRYYTCSHCGYDDIFVDISPLEGETDEAFHRRVEELEATARQLVTENVDVVVQEKMHPVG
jgi:hypothetical protein